MAAETARLHHDYTFTKCQTAQQIKRFLGRLVATYCSINPLYEKGRKFKLTGNIQVAHTVLHLRTRAQREIQIPLPMTWDFEGEQIAQINSTHNFLALTQ